MGVCRAGRVEETPVCQDTPVGSSVILLAHMKNYTEYTTGSLPNIVTFMAEASLSSADITRLKGLAAVSRLTQDYKLSN